MPSLFCAQNTKWLVFVQRIFSYKTKHCLRKRGRLRMNYRPGPEKRSCAETAMYFVQLVDAW